MAKRHEGDHDPENPIELDDGSTCLGCRIQGGYVPNLGAGTTATRTKTGATKPRDPSWEQGVAGEHRPGGTFMPYLNEKGSEIGVKEFGERRRELTATRDSQLHNPHHYGQLSNAGGKA
jgi:hypothetical protein